MRDFFFACLMGLFFGTMFALGFLNVSLFDVFNLLKGN